MRNIFQVYVAASDAFTGRSTSLCLPATPYELLDVLDRCRVEDTGELYCEIEEYYSFSELEPFLAGDADLYELNALAQKLSELDAYQRIAFDGLVKMEVEKLEPFGIPRLIDLAYSTDCCHVAADVGDDEALGRFYAENGAVPKVDDLSDELFELLNFEKIGKEMRQGEGGAFTNCGYVVQHTELTEAYKDLDMTPNAPDYQILLEISGGDSEKTAQFRFPLESCALEMALAAVGANDWREVSYRCLDCRIPALVPCIGKEDIADIDRLAQRLQTLDSEELAKLKAVLEATDDLSVLGAIQAANTLDEYLFSPQYAAPEDVARDFLESCMGSNAEALLPHVNLYAYGQALMQEQQCALTEYGLISPLPEQHMTLEMDSTITM